MSEIEQNTQEALFVAEARANQQEEAKLEQEKEINNVEAIKVEGK